LPFYSLKLHSAVLISAITMNDKSNWKSNSSAENSNAIWIHAVERNNESDENIKSVSARFKK
jgi:hypothetical protein